MLIRRAAQLGAFATLLSFALVASTATALPLVGMNDGTTYILHDHPDGNAAPPTYGIRLDGLYGGGGSEVNTFSFDAGGASMSMTYANDTIVISGTVYENNTGDLWDLDMTYAMQSTLEGAYLGSTGPVGSNTGTITNQTSGLSFGLEDYAPTTFFLGYDHRGFTGISGWGWVNHSASPDHIAASDWLFTVEAPVPEPSAAILFAIGSVVTAGAVRQRQRAS